MNRRHRLPPEVYALVEQTPATVLLDGRTPAKPENNKRSEHPWTQLFTAPLRICVAYETAEIPGLFAAIEGSVANGHAAAGFFTYECGSYFEPSIKARKPAEHPLAHSAKQPLAWFGIYDRSYAFDHETGEFADGTPPDLDRFRADQQEPPKLVPDPEISADFPLTEAEYFRRIAQIHEWIRAGDVYQLNFTAPFRVKAPGSVAAHYACLRLRQPVDYGAFLHWQQGRHILSFSPELFFRINEIDGARRITTRPMKGTAPRGRTKREDRQIAEWLRNDPKNRSENVMIVDLLRNDLGRVARFGTVDTENLFAIERYPTLWQMTSTVTAELRSGIGFHDIFRALFPCGSITGAPKVRAMQIISELEEQPRGVYTGAIGFFSPHQTIFNVAIRTLDLNGATGIMGAGSGVVIDSNPHEEFCECLLKAKFLRPAPQRPVGSSLQEQFSLIEALLWQDDFPFIELHLDRLEDSAEYFGFAFERETARSALADYAASLQSPQPRKVRLLLDEGGSLHVNSELVTQEIAREDTTQLWQVRIARKRTDPADVMLFHKTTCRPLYSESLAAATDAGFDDVLFFNLRGELTESARANVFIEKNDRWFTPPIECGLLAGVYRRHLLETRQDIEERVLYESDLRAADAVYLCNAVRGLRRITIDWLSGADR